MPLPGFPLICVPHYRIVLINLMLTILNNILKLQKIYCFHLFNLSLILDGVAPLMTDPSPTSSTTLYNHPAKFYLVVNVLLSGQKKLFEQNNCSDKKIVRTKKMSRLTFFCLISNALGFFLSIGLLIFVFIIFCQYFCPIVQQKHGTYFKNILQFLRNIMGPSNPNLSHKTLHQVTKHSTQTFIS